MFQAWFDTQRSARKYASKVSAQTVCVYNVHLIVVIIDMLCHVTCMIFLRFGFSMGLKSILTWLLELKIELIKN